ncbi:hypothetical protein [Larkinella terrae]|uniref:Uncharacterized protein n=1 Tax=Larkinella terrae TaxID=2025311 RepID=A0A7K0EL34_9BACT|nr:hypothetical protein [Larkinella terrae]MRS62570.1 hypothetical protein [Larkinella terrae]
MQLSQLTDEPKLKKSSVTVDPYADGRNRSHGAIAVVLAPKVVDNPNGNQVYFNETEKGQYEADGLSD